ncbi:unnamed protein product [Clonostachys rosea]|uniref:EF-hand domain-containing protein n=1 Tax=Bionectria ochroleuca TaxID=29856 RepID=A0ABY6UKM3_BIOOC|nr:unnamed protein product [Clonostachys rosea]
MANERPSTPPKEDQEDHLRPDGLGSFSGTTYSLARGGPDPSELRLERKDFCDRDVIISIEITNDQMRVLHLKHVREDTLEKAKAAVRGFLDQIEPLGDGSGTGGTAFEMFDRVYADMDDQVVTVMGQVRELSSILAKIDTTASMYPKKLVSSSPGECRHDQPYNPVAELWAASDAFYNQVEAIKSKSKSYCDDTHPTRKGFGVTRTNCDVHKNLIASMIAHSRNRGLWFYWDESSYEGRRQRHMGTWRIYIVRFDEGRTKGWRQTLWEWPERLWYLDDPKYGTLFTPDSPPPLFMENDVRPFASYTYVLVEGGPGPQKLHPDVRDTDMLLMIQAKAGVYRLLHLHHVREVTSWAAKAAIDDFLDHFKSIDDNKRGKIDFETRRDFHMFGVSTVGIHQEILEFTRAGVKKRALRCNWETHSWWRGQQRWNREQPDYFIAFDDPCPPTLKSRILMPGSERVLTGFEE